MRALYLFIGPWAASRRQPDALSGRYDDGDLRPILPGAFASWARRDAERAASETQRRLLGEGLARSRSDPTTAR